VTSLNSTVDPSTETFISEPMREALGRSLSHRVSYPVCASDIRRWAIAAYYPQDPPARFIDPAAAARSRWGMIVAPEEFNPFGWAAAEEAEMGGDGGNNPRRIEQALHIPPPPVKFMLNGGTVIEYVTPIRLGDVIRSESRLIEYTERPGRLGLMLFTTTEDIWTNQDGDVVKRLRSTLIRY
jgi:hypothetical protein